MEDTENAKIQKRNGGAFQSMGLSPNVYKAVLRMGYKLPTPIQRKAIPFALDGRDVVAMARTGSGKTAAFMIPVVEKLQTHSLTVGCRALVMSPARELAMQISQYARKLCKFNDLRVTLIVGGSSMETQFENLASNPDIIIATPGRLVHHMDEVRTFSLKAIQMLIFDEADRLFEMGFAEQLSQVLHSAPPTRQVMLVSATMPTQLAEFARAGLRDPAVVRLDQEHTLSDNLATWFCMSRSEDKLPALIRIIRRAGVLLNAEGSMENLPTIEDQEDDMVAAQVSQGELKSAGEFKKWGGKRNGGSKRMRNVCVFCCSRHHVELVGQVLQRIGFSASLVYGNMDQEARTKAVDDFRRGKVQVMVTTDVAARGIDLPILDTVVNFDFPTSAKLFVHRVGRTARAGRSGLAVSLMTLQDLPYVVDLLTFLGKKFIRARSSDKPLVPLGQLGDKMVIGSVPIEYLDSEKVDEIIADPDIATLKRSMDAAFGLYLKTREAASANGVRRAKEIVAEFGGPLEIFSLPHPAFRDEVNPNGTAQPIHIGKKSNKKQSGDEEMDQVTKNEIAAEDWLASLRSFRPSTAKNSTKYQVLSSFEMLNAKRDEMKVINQAAASLAAMNDKDRLKTMGMLDEEEEEEKKDSDDDDDETDSEEEEDEDEWEDEEEDGSDDDESEEGEESEDESGGDLSDSDDEDEETHPSSSNKRKRSESASDRKSLLPSSKAKKTAPSAAAPSAVDSLLARLRAKTDMSSIFDAHRFRSEKTFIDAHGDPSKNEQARQLSLNPSSEGGGIKGLGTFDLLGDDGKDMMKNRSVKKWDAKKKKYITVNVDANGRVIKDTSGNNKRKNEAGGKIDAKAKPGEMYAKWEKSSRKRVGAAGETEDPTASVGKNGKLRSRNIVALGDDAPALSAAAASSNTRAGLAARMKTHPLYKTSTYAGIVEAFENKWKLTHKQERKLGKLRQAIEAGSGAVESAIKTTTRSAKNELVTSATQLAAKRKEAEAKKTKQSPRLRREASMKSREKHMDKMKDRMDKRGKHKRSFSITKGAGVTGREDKGGKKHSKKKGGSRR